MNALITAFILLVSGVTIAQVASSNGEKWETQCSPIFRADWTEHPGTADETLDAVTVCGDGRLIAFHSFTAPAFGGVPAEPTKWDYHNTLGEEPLAELKKILQRQDIGHLFEQGTIKIKGVQGIDGTIRVSSDNKGSYRAIVVSGSGYLARGPEWLDLSDSVRDTICLFSDVYSRAKTGIAPEDGNCKSLHEMAVAKTPVGNPR